MLAVIMSRCLADCCSAIQRMVAGMTLAAVSFVISGVLQLSIDVCRVTC